MYEYASTLVRDGLHTAGNFLAMIQGRIAAWIRGDDITFLVTLAVVALVVLFLMVPNRRRY